MEKDLIYIIVELLALAGLCYVISVSRKNIDDLKESIKNENKQQLSDELSSYVEDKHTQEECIGFIDGFSKAKGL